ncbi:MAG: cytidine deaminase [Eubacteriales bacterium]|nr:cytidine deaminase [Eubacteriales bacterium]
MNEKKLIEKAFEAMEYAYVPYSHFRVGACVLTSDGNYLPGANIENAAYGSTMCAERNAVFGAYCRGYRKNEIQALAIVCEGKRPAAPCGSCRQVLSELLDPKTPIYLSNGEITIEKTIAELLPMSFGEEDLKEEQGD